MKNPARVLLLSCAFAALSPGLGAQEASIPWIGFETIDQSALPILRARLNGSGPYRLVLDVNIKEFLLDTTIVDGSGIELAKLREAAEIDYYGRKEKVPVAVLDSLSLGELSFPMVRTLLIEGEDGTGMGGLRSYGRIGRDLLQALRLTVNYPRRLLYLEPSPPGEVPAGGAFFMDSGRFLVLGVALTASGAPEELEELPFVLDAGTSNSVLDRRWAERNGLAAKGAPAARIPLLRIGGFESKDVPVLLGEMKELPYLADAGEPVGVIGADLLLQLSVTYDFARDLVWLVRVEKEPS